MWYVHRNVRLAPATVVTSPSVAFLEIRGWRSGIICSQYNFVVTFVVFLLPLSVLVLQHSYTCGCGQELCLCMLLLTQLSYYCYSCHFLPQHSISLWWWTGSTPLICVAYCLCHCLSFTVATAVTSSCNTR